MRFALVLLTIVFGACPARLPGTPTLPSGQITPSVPGGPSITWKRVEAVADVPGDTPDQGSYRIHLIDVGTGLAILVQGHDFAMLYDAGTNDREEKPIRVLAYLAAALGPSGDDLCVERGAAPPTRRVKLDHVMLSHPHLDHASAMDLVVHCYDVVNLWDSGRVNDTVFYRELLAMIAKSIGTTYHTAAEVPTDRRQTVKGADITLPTWQRFSEGDTVSLGAAAAFTILHAEGKKLPDPNQNSIVIAIELAGARMLLVGDAESGARKDPSYPAGDVEAHLIEQHGQAIRSDILQVGHHGSKTSSRRDFLAAVKPRLALISSGPKMYGKVTLPDREVIEELARVGATILRTDEHDESCALPRRIGGDRGPGGCDSYIITIVGNPETPVAGALR